MTISDRDLQLENALSPMLVTLEGMIISDRKLQKEYLQFVVCQRLLVKTVEK